MSFLKLISMNARINKRIMSIIIFYGNLALLILEIFVNEDIYIPKVARVDFPEKNIRSCLTLRCPLGQVNLRCPFCRSQAVGIDYTV